jgi:hypothetical protein
LSSGDRIGDWKRQGLQATTISEPGSFPGLGELPSARLLAEIGDDWLVKMTESRCW